MEDSTLQYVNYFLIVCIVLSIASRLFFRRDQGSNPLAAALGGDKPILFKEYTPAELEKFSGENDSKVLMAVKGDVFDVTAGKSFYGPGGPYSNFAGHDASRGLAKNSFDEEMLTPVGQSIDLLEDLSKEEQKALSDWHDMFMGKYILCGKLVNEKEKTK